MKSKVNERYLKIKGFTIPVEKPMDYKEYAIALMVAVKKIGRPDTETGDTEMNPKTKKLESFRYIDVVYESELCGELVIKDEFEKVYIKKEKRSQSQLLRGQIINGCKGETPLDEHYKDRMILLRHFWYIIDPYLDQLKKKEDAGGL